VATVLLVDDDRDMFTGLEAMAAAEGIGMAHAPSLREAIRLQSAFAYDLILIKDRLPDGVVTEAIPSLCNAATPEMIVYTRGGNPVEAELILNIGCWDYLIDPTPGPGLLDLIQNAIRYHQEKLANCGPNRGDLCKLLQNEGMIGNSQPMQQCLDLVPKAAKSDVNVLITGESGTGKELFASAIHRLSPRSAKKLVVVDCAALPKELVESILFGNDKGAFTGADKNREGLVKQADGGTLFLDEVGELPLELQKKFLRVLQERTFRPVGGREEISSNFRLIAATNKNLRGMCEKKTFREDLLFRLQTFHLELPPLRVRANDITELAYYFEERHNRYSKGGEKKFSPDFLMILKQYDWPGNVRELFHALEYAILTAQDNTTLYPMHLPTNIRVQVTRNALNARQAPESRPADAGNRDHSGSLPLLHTLRERVIEDTEKEYLKKLVTLVAGDIRRAQMISGLSRSRLYNLLNKYGISLKTIGKDENATISRESQLEEASLSDNDQAP
jgi:two-component system NtrC family response regulator